MAYNVEPIIFFTMYPIIFTKRVLIYYDIVSVDKFRFNNCIKVYD